MSRMLGASTSPAIIFCTCSMSPLLGAGKFEKGAVAWVSSIDPAAGKEGFRIANEACVQEGQVRKGMMFRL